MSETKEPSMMVPSIWPLLSRSVQSVIATLRLPIHICSSNAVCAKCRKNEEKHSLITRTKSKAKYLLKDYDFDRREPVLRYVNRKNSHIFAYIFFKRISKNELYPEMMIFTKEIWTKNDFFNLISKNVVSADIMMFSHISIAKKRFLQSDL